MVLVTTQKGDVRKDLSAYASQQGIPELSVSKTIVEVDKMFVLGSGKTDYSAVQQLVEGTPLK